MNDNLRANQKMFSIFHKTYKPRSLFSIAHPIPNDTIDELFLLYDPTHLLKNIRNNWCREKLQKLKYTDPKTKEVSIACWKDLIQLYNCECESIVKQTQLDFPSLYPTNFEKQKVSLALRVFNEKTVNFKISKI